MAGSRSLRPRSVLLVTAAVTLALALAAVLTVLAVRRSISAESPAGGASVADASPSPRPSNLEPYVVAARTSEVAGVIDAALAADVDLRDVPQVARLLRAGGDGTLEGEIGGTPFAEVEDMLLIARQNGQTGVEVVARDLRETDRREVVQAAIRHADLYAGSELSEDGEELWLGFTGEVPADVAALAEDVPGTTVQGGLPSTAADLEQLQDTVLRALAGSGIAVVAVEPAPRTGTVVVGAPDEAGVARTRDALSGAGIDPARVEVIVRPVVTDGGD